MQIFRTDCWALISEIFSYCFCPAVTPGAQLLEQTARLQSLNDTLDRLKVQTKHKAVKHRENKLIKMHKSYIKTLLFKLMLNLKLELELSLHLFCFCQDEVAEHVVNLQPGARVSSDFATFPSTSFVKVSLLVHAL